MYLKLTFYFIACFFTFIAYATACVKPTGIDDGSSGSLDSSRFQPLDDIFLAGYIPAAGEWHLSHEVAIQMYYNFIIAGSHYSALAAHEPKALDPWARHHIMNKRRRCLARTVEEEELLQLHRDVVGAYTILYLIRIFVDYPDADPVYSAIMEERGLNSTKCQDDISECDDLSTPWGIAYTSVKDWLTWTEEDGWNRDGTLQQKFNLRPFSDWRNEPYNPVNTPWNVTFLTRWTPLLEDDGNGFSYHQTHVVPHIGSTAKSIYIADKDLCRRTVPDPGYDLKKEIRLALKRTSQLDDRKKMAIEFLDNKTNSLARLSRQWRALHGIGELSFQKWADDYTTNSAIYHALLVNWREKTRHDLVRPTTVAQILGKGKVAMTYAGPGAGIQKIPVDQWEPFIRTMPHAEFPSFSACICEVFREASVLANNGSDQIGGTVSQKFSAGSSAVEPGIVPEQDLVLEWTRFSDIAKDCGQSRLDGGMHFTDAIPAGVQLCTGIAGTIYKAVGDLIAGNKPEYLLPLDSPLPSQERCLRKGYRDR